MSFTHTYTVPAYYPDFHCKAGNCRHPCCSGWSIAISMQEYFRMVGMDCSPELRRRLDTAFHPAEDPSENHYAMITPRWDGDCPLHLPNGYCGLQCECGEEAIPSVCRYYPRSPKSHHAYQCQCSNSCEAVVEQLFACEAPMTFLSKRLTFRMNDEIPHERDAVSRLFPAIQRACLHILQDRTRPLSLRLRHLGELTRVMDVPYRQGNAAGIRAVLPFSAVASEGDGKQTVSPLSDRDLLGALTYVRNYLCHIEQSNPQLRDTASMARQILQMPDEGDLTVGTASRWRDLASRMAACFPDNERMLEQIFVNHLCYDGYPLSGERKSMWDSYLSFCSAYALVRVLSVCHLAACGTEERDAQIAAYADIVAAVFRLVEHTGFGHNTAILARRWAFTEPEQMGLLCQL